MSSTAHDQTPHHTTPLPNQPIPSVQETHRLISLFLPDFLRLAEPDSAAQMNLQSCELLSAAEDDKANLIRAHVQSRLGEKVTVIVAVEPEALPTQQIAEKLARVLLHSELAYGTPVLLSVIYLSGGRPGLHLESAQIGTFGNVDCVRMYFTTWSLSESRADHYLQRPEPLAWALAPYMRFTSRTQQELLEASRERIREAQLSDDLRTALLRFLSPDLHGELAEEVVR